MSKNILITGGTGLLGSALSQKLESLGFNLAYLSRSSGKFRGHQKFKWDIPNGHLDLEAIRWADSIIHLAGAGVADKKWTNNRKKEILKSRVESTKLLYNSIKSSEAQVNQIISASAIGYYGFADSNSRFKENDEAANDFLAEVTKEWENETKKFSELGIPNSQVRIGVVLSSKGGAFQKIMQPINFGLGAPLGSGKQGMSWIHIEDLVDIFLFLLENKQEGVFNGVAPNPVSNQRITKSIAKALGRPLFLPNVPAFVLKIVLGEMSDIVLKGSYVSSDKLEQSGFNFNFPEIDTAVADIVQRKV